MPVSVTLVWNDPITEAEQELVAITPIAIGRDSKKIATQKIPTRQQLILSSLQVSGYHALINWKDGKLTVTDQGSRNGTYVNGKHQNTSTLTDGDVIQVGPYQITVIRTKWPSRTISIFSSKEEPRKAVFPPCWFIEADSVALGELAKDRLLIEERDFAAIGGGLGSFVWTNLLRVSGARPEQIKVLGKLQLDETGNIRPAEQQKPYWNYKQLCEFSQIPAHERLRSNSDSCPDNIWGWPSYALRESWRDFIRGNLNSSLRYLWQVFAEPTLAETYTPKSGNVFASIDREAKRIGWDRMFHYGDVRAIRKTNDGRYAIAYSLSSAKGKEYAYLVARYIHLAIGYPALRYLPLVTAYREKTEERFNDRLVVNAYEGHEHVYSALEERRGGAVVIQGRGIVASRIIQKIYETRNRDDCKINIIHLMRSPVPKGHKFEQAQRPVKHHQEQQPFNWPKACWGGELREMLENANPEERKRLLSEWGGTSTADRRDWQRIIDEGIEAGWYKVIFGEIKDLNREGKKLRIDYLEKSEGRDTGQQTIRADFLVDATGLTNEIQASPLLNDLVNHYKLDLNPTKRLFVTNSFEANGMRNGSGRLYASGAMTLGGPYAAVDSFLGLQYAALCSVDDLVSAGAPGINVLNRFGSFQQWLRWVMNQTPEGKNVKADL